MKLIQIPGFQNENSILENGWYCMKQPSTMEPEKGLGFQELNKYLMTVILKRFTMCLLSVAA